MAKAIASLMGSVLSVAWLTGPIFGKELRVSSRRRRNYLLRFAYLMLLTIFLVAVWSEVVRSGRPYGSAAYRVSRMSEAGKAIVATIVWFQFCVTQLVAIVMLSTAISGEIHHRTLGVLMTTPIGSFQIVMGKLLSGLWQLLILVGLSLPLLAVVRVFGGVPWDFVVAGLCVTAATLILVGSVSLFCSIFTRRSYVVILVTLFVLGVVMALAPGMIFAALEKGRSDRAIIAALSYANPYGAMLILTDEMLSPRAWARWSAFSWEWHCLIMLALSAGVIALSVGFVRRAATRQLTGETRAGPRAGRRRRRRGAAAAELRPVTGSPVLWKELRAPILRGRRRRWLMLGAVIGVVLITYLIAFAANDLDDGDVQVLYVFCFVCAGTLTTAVISATPISSEKESGTWPLLLVTTLGAGQILWGKAIGILRKCAPAWALLGGHLVVFMLAGILDPTLWVHASMVAAYVSVFLVGSGLYFSARCRRTTVAVAGNLCLIIAIWVILPFLAVLAAEGRSASLRNSPVLRACIEANPGVQAISTAIGAARQHRPSRYYPSGRQYYWPSGRRGLGETTLIVLATAVGYSLAGGVFARRAAARLRRSIF